MRRFFVDTFYLIALSNRRDQWHRRVVTFSRALRDVRLYTVDEVLAEFLTFSSTGTGSVEWERFCHLKPFTYTMCIWKISCTVIRLSRMPKATAGTSRVVKWTRRK
jgi:hypothetical protein